MHILPRSRFQALWGALANVDACREKLENVVTEYPLLDVNPEDVTPFMIPSEDLPVDFLAYASKLFRQNLEKVAKNTTRESLYQAIQRMQNEEEASEGPTVYYVKSRQSHKEKMKRFIQWYLQSFDAWASRWGGKVMAPKWEVMKAQFRVHVSGIVM